MDAALTKVMEEVVGLGKEDTSCMVLVPEYSRGTVDFEVVLEKEGREFIISPEVARNLEKRVEETLRGILADSDEASLRVLVSVSF